MKKPRNAFRTWTHAEDMQVCEEVRRGMDSRDVAKAHDRTVPSIVARLVKLGKIAPRAGSAPRAAGGIYGFIGNHSHRDACAGPE
jgi:hypothetical protein